MKSSNEQQKIEIYEDQAVHERHVYLLKQKKTADDDDYNSNGTRWPSGTVPDFVIARSRVRIPPMAAVYQLSVPSLQGRLMSTSERWGVNGHTTRCTSPVSVVLRLWLVSG